MDKDKCEECGCKLTDDNTGYEDFRCNDCVKAELEEDEDED